MDEASCGPALPNQNSDWCGGAAFTCQNEVSTAKCPATGKATLLRTWGTGSWAAPVYIKGCKYSYYAQWECVGVCWALCGLGGGGVVFVEGSLPPPVPGPKGKAWGGGHGAPSSPQEGGGEGTDASWGPTGAS